MRIFISTALFLALGFFRISYGMGFPHTDPALRCKDHIAYQNGLNPVIVSSWTFPESALNVETPAYLARYSGHVYAPVGSLSSNKYKGLDLFHTANRNPISAYEMHFQRPAKMYLFVDVPDSAFDVSKNPSLPSWKDEGWAQLVQGQQKITYGIHQKLERKMTKYAKVYSRMTGSTKDSIFVPQTNFIAGHLKSGNVNVPGTYNLWIAEGDGKASAPVGAFRGQNIQPNTRCPDRLHDAWVARDNNPDDADTRNQLFSTWHPQWDPCWWCAYDHEHGSSPKHLMGYEPKFTYTAWKNNRQDESDNGFKGVVLRNGDYLMYFNIHVQQSSLRRVKTRFHTIHMVIVERKTKKLMMDITHKGDFGFQSVRLADGRTFRPIDPEEKAISDEQESKKAPVFFRSINVLDPANPNNEFRIRAPLLLGQYEVWQTLPICTSAPKRNKLLEITFKNPNNGIKFLDKPDLKINLGRKEKRGGTTFIRSTGVNRALSCINLKISTSLCPQGAKGYFYTDPDGKKILSGPGPNAVRQFAREGFQMTLNGRYDVVDRWTGMHTKGSRGFFTDHGYGINPDRN